MILERINNPADLKSLTIEELQVLSTEVREFLIENITHTGGHLGSNLGIVELSIAVHYVFHSPHDPIIFDTGHQCYVHKILTGRKNLFPTLRQKGGLSGYPSRKESEHDWLESSHASSALSLAIGIAQSHRISTNTSRNSASPGDHSDALRPDLLKIDPRTVITILGDGSLTGGMAWEALNHLSVQRDLPLLIIINDNGLSYSPTIGTPSAQKTYDFLCESVGLEYRGPYDGHDITQLIQVFTESREKHRPQCIHILTEKGYGYPQAQYDSADRMHTIRASSSIRSVGTKPRNNHDSDSLTTRTGTEVFSSTLCELGKKNTDIVAITAAMAEPTGVQEFSSLFPERFFDVGIAEQHALTFAAGLAMGGLRPVVALYSTFLTRAHDQLLMDIGLHRLPVVIALDRSGITGPDGPSHHGMWDMSIIGTIPGCRCAIPRDAQSLELALRDALESSHLSIIRYAKGEMPQSIPVQEHYGNYDLLFQGSIVSRMRAESGDRDEDIDSDTTNKKLILILTYGVMAAHTQDAVKNMNVYIGDQSDELPYIFRVISPLWAIPVEEGIVEECRRADFIISVEDHLIHGGAGNFLHIELQKKGIYTPMIFLGLPRQYIPHAQREEIWEQYGLDSSGIAHQIHHNVTQYYSHLLGNKDEDSDRSQEGKYRNRFLSAKDDNLEQREEK